MRRHIRKKDVLTAVLVALVVIVAGVALDAACAGLGTILSAGLAAAAILTALLALYRLLRETRDEQRNHYRQLEALQSLIAVVQPTHPLPPLRGWAASPDFANLLVDETLAAQPQTVVECGSGTSTLLIAYILRRLGKGHIWSLDHDPTYAEETRSLLERHGLSGWATVSACPLVTQEAAGGSWRWYDLAQVELPEQVGLLVVDGPPGSTQSLARYPAFPVLRSRLTAEAAILLDDADRPDERAIVERWISEVPDLHATHIPTEKGTAIIRRSTP